MPPLDGSREPLLGDSGNDLMKIMINSNYKEGIQSSEEFKQGCDSPKIPTGGQNVPTVTLPKKINPNIHAGPVEKIYKKYMNIDISNKVSEEGKVARNLLGLGDRKSVV